jgi:hypothetical protein
VEYEDLDISQLGVGSTQSGVYRGQKVRRVPAFDDQPEVFLARVFLETAGGPMTVQVDHDAISHIEALGVVDGDRIIVTRLTEDDFSVARKIGGS